MVSLAAVQWRFQLLALPVYARQRTHCRAQVHKASSVDATVIAFSRYAVPTVHEHANRPFRRPSQRTDRVAAPLHRGFHRTNLRIIQPIHTDALLRFRSAPAFLFPHCFPPSFALACASLQLPPFSRSAIRSNLHN